MKTKNYKLQSVLFCLIVMGLSGFMGANAFGQTGTFTNVHQPCTGDGSFTLTMTGMTPPLTFFYYDPTHQMHSSGSLVDNYTGEYTPWVYVTDNFGGYWFENTPLTLPFNVDIPFNTTPAQCPNPGSATITINSGALPDYVEWYDNSSPYPGVYVGTGNPMSLLPGEYKAKVYSASCYVFLDSTIFIENVSPVYFGISTTPANCTNGTATITGLSGGTPPYSYHWWNGATSASVSGLSSGEYSVTVTDNSGCYTERFFYINQVVQIPVNFVVIHPPTCLLHDGAVMAFGSGGTTPYSYLWSDGQVAQEAISLSGGTNLSVIVTDHNGCTGTSSILLNATTPIQVTYTATPSSCMAQTGSATLAITGGISPYTVVWNTYPQQTGNTASNLPAGNYRFTVTDNTGCVQTGIVIIPPQSVINASIYSTNAVCPLNTGSAGVSCSGTASPFTYLWNTSATTSNIYNLSPANYSCQITDANGCSVTKNTQVYSVSPVHIGITSVPATCMYAFNGSLTAYPTGGSGSYSYYWSNGATSNPATNLAPGNYWVTVTDVVTGCSKIAYCIVGNSATSNACYCRIDGYVYHDQNANCAFDPGEPGIDHIQVHLDPFGYTWTDATGYYSFLVPTGNYTLSEVVQYIYPLTPVCPNNDPVPVSVTASSGCHQTHDFFNIINPLQDVHLIATSWTRAIPGNPYSQQLIIQNDGTVPGSDIYMNYMTDTQISLIGGSTIPLNPLTSPWYENLNPVSLSPGANIASFIYYNNLPTNIPLGTILNFTGIVSYNPPISNWLNDFTPWNNYRNFQETVVGSYDPNDKEVFPKGDGTQGLISVNDSVLDYVIHFQNTGTYYAENVILIDTLDQNMDFTTLKPGYGSHPYTAELSQTGILKFTFKNIHLVWKAENEINSNGIVTYSIKQKPDLAIGTKIQNKAAIYFDYNAPVITNTTLNTISFPAGTSRIAAENGIQVYPDPVEAELYVKTGSFGLLSSLSIYDVTGRLMQTRKIMMDAVQKVPVNDLPTGMYFITLVNVHGEKSTCKFVKK